MECNRVFAIIPHHFTFEILHSVQNDILRTPIFSIFILCIGNFNGFYGKTKPSRYAMHICLAIFY